MAGYTNGDGKYHEVDRRENPWYDNKQLYEMIVSLKDALAKSNNTLENFARNFEKYNGMWDKIKEIESKPCAQSAEIDSMRETLREAIDFISKVETQRTTREKMRDDFIKYSGYIIGAIGGTLGAILSYMALSGRL